MVIKPGETVLEIGCGTGKALVDLGNRVGEKGAVHSLDLSPGMLRVVGFTLVKGSHGKSSQLSCGDGAGLSYASGVFSCLFMTITLELFNISEIPVVLGECSRVLQPSGRMGVVAMAKSKQPNPADRLYEWAHTHFPTYVDCRPIDAEARIQAAGFCIADQQVHSMWDYRWN